MPLIRVMRDSSDHNKWFNNTHTPTELMKHIIGNDTPVFSVYHVITALEETKAVAAQFLLYTDRSNFNTVSALRIELGDINDIEIEIEETSGETGIAEIDLKHRNLIGNINKFEILFHRVHEALHRGEDRVRVFGRTQLTYQVQEFQNLNSDAANNRAKSRCQKLLAVGR